MDINMREIEVKVKKCEERATMIAEVVKLGPYFEIIL